VHGGQDFHWAEIDFHKATQLDSARAMKDRAYLWETWRKYLLAGRNFWSGGLIRIFARELIGLNRFKYMPIFSTVEIMFKPSSPGLGTFKEYLDALDAVGFKSGAGASRAINALLGEFLFGDDEALSGLGLNQS
jgi:hypothetical protein